MMTTSTSPKEMITNSKKSCVECHTTKTPLWRGGPAGPKSLCNACGIKYRKKRKAQQLGLERVGAKNKKIKTNGCSEDMSVFSSHPELILPPKDETKSSLSDEKEKEELREVEEAAMILWAMANGITLS